MSGPAGNWGSPAAAQSRRGVTIVTHLLLTLAILVACGDSTAPAPLGDGGNGGGGDVGNGGGDGDGGNGGGGMPTVQLAVQEVASGLGSPVHLTAPAGDGRLFVVEQAGRIRIVRGGELLATPFLDIDSIVQGGAERGLLSMAFHPQYATNGFFYVNYSDNSGDTRVVRYSVTADPNVADPGSAKILLTIEQPFPNHNGGQLAFGPDGMLYIGMGDGGSGGDPLGSGQDLGTLLGALLRIDVDGGDPYAVPPDNPFVGVGSARDEIWAFGLRNPWRFSFDPPSGLIFIADVGQNAWEEVSVAPANSAARNYGWNVMEGLHCFGAATCDQTGLTLPAVEYANGSIGCSVIGGFVYRGSAIPETVGHYFYSDYCSGWLRSFRYVQGSATDEREWEVGSVGGVLSFGVDAQGELYILSQSGRVYRLVKSS